MTESGCEKKGTGSEQALQKPESSRERDVPVPFFSQPQTARILYCHCAYAQVVPKEVKHEVLARLTAAGVAFEAVPDLCELSARGDGRLGQLAQAGELRIAACYPRAVKWLFDAAGAPLPAIGPEIRNMRVESAADVVEGLLRPCAAAGAAPPEGAAP